MDVDEEWVEDGDVPPTLNAKVQALKVCRNRCLAHASTDTALDISTPVLKMFVTLIQCGGLFTADAVDEYVRSMFFCLNICAHDRIV
jgi:sister chromatid cohesion protein PDS5